MGHALERYKKTEGVGPFSTLGLPDWNGLCDEVGTTLADLKQKGDNFDAIANQAIGVLLDRINSVLGPAYDDVEAKRTALAARLALLNGTGVSADAVLETATRLFLSPTRRDKIDAHDTAIAAILAGADSANDSFAEIAARLGGVDTALGKRLRFDTDQTLTSAEGAQARFNIGFSAPHRIAAALNIDPKLGIRREYEFTGPFTATAPATADVRDGWTTGVFHNRGNGSAATANFVGTIAVPNGAYLNGTVNGTVTLAYGQKGYLYWDANASPNATWRWVWVDRNPRIFTLDFSGVASFDWVVPPGFRGFDIVITNLLFSSSGDVLTARHSATNAAGLITAANSYVLQCVNYNGSALQGSALTAAYMQLTLAGANPAAFKGGASIIRGYMDAKYGAFQGQYTQVASNGAQATGVFSTYLGDTPSITPALTRFLCINGGATISGQIIIEGRGA